MRQGVVLLFALMLSLLACTNKGPDMYEASPLAQLMRDMVEFNKSARLDALEGRTIDIPDAFYSIREKQATRDEQKDDAFQSMAALFLARMKDVDGNAEPAEAYHRMINACIHCHNTYCGGPLEIINQLQISTPEKQLEIE